MSGTRCSIEVEICATAELSVAIYQMINAHSKLIWMEIIWRTELLDAKGSAFEQKKKCFECGLV